MFSFRPLALVVCTTAVVAAALSQSSPQTRQGAREEAYRANNVGVAHLEQYDYERAVASFRDALLRDPELHVARVNFGIALFYAGQEIEAITAVSSALESAPNLPQAHYVLGLATRAQGRVDEASGAFQRVLQLDPADVGSRINLGQIALQQRQYKEAIGFFRDALEREPFNATASYGVATALTRSGAADEGREQMQRFEALRDSAYAITYAQRYLEQGRYGEAMVSTGLEPDLVDSDPPPVTFSDATAAMFGSAARPAGDFMVVSGTPGASVNLFDADDDGDLDLFATSSVGGHLQRFFTNAKGSFAEATEKARLGLIGGTSALGAVVGDYDNDLRPDILLLRPGGLELLRQREDRSYEGVTERAGLAAKAGFPRSAAFVDTDHDGDLDLVVAYKRVAGSEAHPPHLFRNNGNGTFTDITVAAGISGTVDVVGIAPTDFDNRRDIDLLMLGAGTAPRLFQNMRDGTFRDVAARVGLPPAAAYGALAAADINKDGFIDFYFGRSDGAGVIVMSDGRGGFSTAKGPDGDSAADFAQFVDYDNDGLLDLFTAHRRSLRLFRNVGSAAWSNVTTHARLDAVSGALNADVVSIAFGDLDRDGDLDAAALLANGELRSWRNDGANRNVSLLVTLAGRVSNRSGVGSKVDVRAGSLRQRLEVTAVTPALMPSDLLFGLGPRKTADVVRVIWPSGTVQAETTGDERAVTVSELDRKPSSCPYLYTWNGSRFEFVTDFMGGGEIGYWQAPGLWNTPDPDEYVLIRPEQLVEKDGRFEVRVTNELEEALFVDRLQLVAVDHDEDIQVFPNEGLGAPGPAALLTTTRRARPPIAAADQHGHDVLDRLKEIDRKYPDDFALMDIRGYAAEHELRIDIGAAAGGVLLATGWTDYAFSGDNVAAHQRGMRLMPPALDARTPSGAWRRVLDNIGIPVGRPQTVVIDLRGRLQPGEREVRFVTNMRIYWDQVLVDRSGSNAEVAITRLDPTVADLRWRGFSAEVSPDGRQPYVYDYDRVSRVSPWKTMTGNYTREGDVRELVRNTDDMFVISRPGDEIALSFDASALPELTAGRRRTLLLYSDGFSKEMDINSATPYTVEPLPFHAMRTYPYGPDERYPSTAAHRDYRARYNTRTVSKPLPPIEAHLEGRVR